MKSSVQGTYLHPESYRIFAVLPESTAPGEQWIKFTDDYRLRLLAARRELLRLGMLDDPSRVEWYGMSTADLEQRRRVSSLIQSFRAESDRLHREAESKQDFWQRLVSGFRSSPTRRGEEA